MKIVHRGLGYWPQPDYFVPECWLVPEKTCLNPLIIGGYGDRVRSIPKKRDRECTSNPKGHCTLVWTSEYPVDSLGVFFFVL